MEQFDEWDTELYHHGIKGQKWGIRRFQNSDGTLTAEGIQRYRHTFGEVYRGVRKQGTPNSNATPDKLGYIPMKGKKGNAVQKDIARRQMASERYAAIFSEKAAGATGAKQARLAKTAKKWVEAASEYSAMQKRYYELGPIEQRHINNGKALVNAMGFLAGPIGMAAANIKYESRLNKLKKNALADRKSNPSKYD